MSTDQRNSTDEAEEQEPSRSPLEVVRGFVAKAKEKPLRTALYSSALIGVVLAAYVGMRLKSLQAEKEKEITLQDTLEKLDSGDYVTAKRFAKILRQRDSLPYEQLSAPAYVLGVATFHQAEAEWNSAQKKNLYMVAARYLEEARARGFPPEHKVDGLLLLAESLHHGGRYVRSLPVLRDALDEAPQHRSRIHQLLATSYLYDSNPQYDKALKHNQEYLADPAISPHLRNTALLERSEILFGLGQLEQSREVLKKIPDTSENRAEVILMRGRILMYEADQLLSNPELANSGENRSKADGKYAAAIKEFRLAQANATFRNQAAKRAKYLLGVCLHRMEDYRAAEEHFSRIHPPQFDMAVSIAAGLEEAEVKRSLGKNAEAVVSYRRVLDMAGEPAEYSNPWVSLDALRNRLQEAYAGFVEDQNHEQAIALTSSLWPMFSRSTTVQLLAEAQRSWAEYLESEAASQSVSKAEPILVQSRVHYRKAGIAYAKLAQLKVITREYAEEIWRSAENYLLGHDYVDAVRMLKEYLTNRNRPRTPQALVAMGEAQLALGDLDEAIESLTNCIEQYPKHPDTYQARLVASDAYVEKGLLAEAKKLLTDNLHNEELTPRSAEWRDSLFALGKVYHQEGVLLETESQNFNLENVLASKESLKSLEKSYVAHLEAVKQLSEAVFRYPGATQTIEAQYMIARSHSQAAKWPEKKLAGVSIETTKLALSRQMHSELQAALRIYDSLSTKLIDKQDRMELNEVESFILRNCYFSRADILFAMQDYLAAISAYSTATNRYHGKPESLEAFVQIARCYRELGRDVEARGTLEQAKVILRRVTNDAGFLKTTRYSREEWMELLDWLSTLK